MSNDRIFPATDTGGGEQTPPALRGGGGIAGKMSAIYDERETLKERNAQLEAQVAELLREKTSAEEIKKFGLSPNDSERETLDAILFAFNRIAHEWKLKANHGELAAATHVLQGFVIQHMLSRLAPEWGSWWEAPEPTEPPQEGSA